jgi:hypothetical protein
MGCLQRSHNKESYYIRRLLTEGGVRASDKRAQFVGIDAYETAGGDVDCGCSDAGRYRQACAASDSRNRRAIPRLRNVGRAPAHGDHVLPHQFSQPHAGSNPSTTMSTSRPSVTMSNRHVGISAQILEHDRLHLPRRTR